MKTMMEIEVENRKRADLLLSEWKKEADYKYIQNEWLSEKKKEIEERLVNFYAWYQREIDTDGQPFGRVLIYELAEIPKLEKELNRILWRLRTVKNDEVNPRQNRITNDKIYQCKNYPWENLIQIKNNMALCPFHDDKNPSMLVKNGFAYCFSCGKSWDQIAFVMEKEGIGFQEAVRSLQ